MSADVMTADSASDMTEPVKDFVHLLDLNPPRENPIKLDGFPIKGIKKLEFALDSDRPGYAWLNLELLVKVKPDSSPAPGNH